MSTYTAIRSEGGLIPPDTLEKIAQEQVPGQRARDFGLGDQRLSDVIARAWSDALDYWHIFLRRAEALSADDPGTTLTRDRWVAALLNDLLGYDLAFQRPAPQIEGRSYPISHRADPAEDAPPVHIVGFRQSLDHRAEGYRRLSPQALVQEYLNRSEPQLWGVVTNGMQLRLLRDSTRSSRPTYLEFDLQGILDGQRFNEFVLFFRLCHRTRLPRTSDESASCLVEQYYQASIEEGARVRDHLRDGVEKALLAIGNGLLRHPDNGRLREAVRAGALTENAYYQQLLRLVYRLLFLMVAEERRMIVAGGPQTERAQRIYDEHYSVRSLRDRAERPIEEGLFSDLWIGLQQTFRLFDSSDNPLGVPPLNGDLFGPDAMPDLMDTGLCNHDLLLAIRRLSLFPVRGVMQRVNYAGLDVEELGSVYESLLDFQPVIREEAGSFSFDLAAGMERKSTGSYYTHPDLVGELAKSALVPVMEERLAQAKTAKAKEEALLGLTVCDPASGSGHFLLAAARRIGRDLARARTGEEEPTPEEFRKAVRDVIRHCIYGVDVNPLAVDLCRLSLWIEGHNVGLPLTFLDHRIKCGNSLIGIFDARPPEVPDEAFTAVTGDDKKVATAARKRNRYERSPKGAQQLQLVQPEPVDRADVNRYAAVAILPDDSPDRVHAKKHEYEEWQNSEAHQRRKLEADIWCAAFFWPFTEEQVDGWIPTTGSYLQALSKPSSVPEAAKVKIEELSRRHRFFHWCLEFPDVFARGGFDVVLGNPPWERIKLEQEEFFAAREPEIARAPNRAARERMINALPKQNPRLHADYQAALHDAEAESRFVRQGGRFALTARGDINTYALFTELARYVLGNHGRAGVIVPPGIATDDTTKVFFSDLMEKSSLVALLGMDNEAMIYFTGIDHRNKFSLLCLAGRDAGVAEPVFTFSCSRLEYTALPQRRFNLSSDDIALLNPNTRTCPVFRTRVDAELTKTIYRRVPVLVREAHENRPQENPWCVSFQRMIDMSNDSGLFSAAGDLQGGGNSSYLPLYEAKLLHQFDHRWATYKNASGEDLRKGLARDLTDDEKRDPRCAVEPRYWVPRDEVEARLSDRTDRSWLLGFRGVTSSVVERTVISSVLPRTGVGNSAPLLLTPARTTESAALLANLNAIVLDYAARTKIAGPNLNFFYMTQFPIIPPSDYGQPDVDFIVPRVLELTYTAWDLKPFAEDLGYDGPPFTWDPERRAILRAELDAYYARLYGLTRKQLRYILDPHGLSAKELEDILDPWEDPTCSGPHLLPAEPALDFPGETFRVLKEKEERLYGEYRTRRLVLAAWQRLFGGD